MSVGRVIRGLRDRIPPGYVLGRVKPGLGPVELIKVPGLSQPSGLGGASNIATGIGDAITALTGDVTATGPGSVAATIPNDTVTYAKMQNVSAASKLLGRGDSGAGDPQEITLGTNVSMSGTTLNVAGGSGGTAATTTEVLTGTDATKYVTPDALAALWEKGSDVASAGTISLGEGGFFHITGTTAITDIDFGTDKSGRKAILVFDGILTLTHNATSLILPTGANITTAAGDACCVVSEDGTNNVRVVWYQRKDGTALAGGGDAFEYVVETVTTSGSQATITFSTMPSSSYKDLEIRVWARGDDAGADIRLEIRFNGDTGSNYDYEQAFFGAADSYVQNAAQTRIFGPQFPGAGTTANYYGDIILEIPNFANTTAVKQVLGRCSYFRTGSGMRAMVTGGQWLSTSAITSITLLLHAGNFVDGSIAKLIARK